MDLRAVAARAGVGVETVRVYLHRARAREREHGQRRERDMPEPAGYIGRSPWWDEAVIEAWIAARPGRTGRPRRVR